WTAIRSPDQLLGVGLAVAIGVVTAVVAVFFRWLIDAVNDFSFGNGERLLGFAGEYYVIVIPALGGLIVGPLIYFFAQETRGPGVAAVMSAVTAHGGRIRSRVAVIKTLASSVCIGTGGSVGREGPIVHIGSSIGSTLGQRLNLPHHWINTFVACGAASGISATFNAPLAGVLFGLEVILARFTARTFGIVVLSSVTAAAVAHGFLGDEIAFVIPAHDLVSPLELPIYVLLGLAAALVAHIFVGVLYWSEDFFDQRVRMPTYLKPALGGLGVGALGVFYPELFGVGYGAVEFPLLGEMALGLMIPLLFLKIVATSLTLGSGGSGGVFAPSLFMGAMLGGTFGVIGQDLLPGIVPGAGAYALVGMAAVFAGVARAPITAIVIIVEMTRDYEIILPLMAAVVVSMLLARALRTDSVYTLKMRREGVIRPDEEESAVLREVTVEEAMTRDYPVVYPGTSVGELAEMFSETGHHGFPVVTPQGRLIAMVTVSDLSKIRTSQYAHFAVRDIATREVMFAYPDETVHDALARLGGPDLGRIPVVSREDGELIGVLRRHDIVRVYTRTIGLHNGAAHEEDLAHAKEENGHRT
ncbi:MAG: chloride channel protein, partial [Chloroflexota bacterium]